MADDRWAKVKAVVDPKRLMASRFTVDGKPLCVRTFELRPDRNRGATELILVIGEPGFELTIDNGLPAEK